MASHPGGRFETLMRGEHGSHRMVATCAVVIHQRKRAGGDAAAPGPERLPHFPRQAGGAPRSPRGRRRVMTDPQSWVAPTYLGLAELLPATAVDRWDAPTLCEKWLVRHVIAHVTMPARLTPEQFGAEMADGRRQLRRTLRHRGHARRSPAPSRPARAAPIPGVARMAAAGRRRSRFSEPCRHPLAGCDDRARPARRRTDGGCDHRPRPAHCRARRHLWSRPD